MIDSEDTYEPASIDALAKAGLDFARHRSHGIRPFDFAELMITSGLVLLEGVTWISYHGCVLLLSFQHLWPTLLHSAYDFAFLLRTLTNIPLPLSEEEFFTSLRIWFPQLYDIKYIMRQIKPSLKGGLVEVANDLGVGGVRYRLHAVPCFFALSLSALYADDSLVAPSTASHLGYHLIPPRNDLPYPS